MKEMSGYINEAQFLGENIKKNKLQYLRMVSQQMNTIRDIWMQVDMEVAENEVCSPDE